MKKLLYKQPERLCVNKKDCRPHDPYSVYQYVLENSYLNPFGVIISNNIVHTDSMYSLQLPLSLLQRIRLKCSFLLKKKHYCHFPVLSITHGYYNNFYHFTLECLPKIFLLRGYLNNKNVKILLPKTLAKYHKEWIIFLGLEDNILQIDDNHVVSSEKIITCSFPGNSSNHHKLILLGFRNWILSKMKKNEFNTPQKIFIGRRKGERRNIINNEEVKSVAARFDYHYIEMEDFNLEEQIMIVNSATHILAIHGAALSHLTFADRKVKVVEIINEDFHYHFYEKICLALEIKYSSLLAKQVDKKEGPNHSDLYVNINELKALISLNENI